MGFGQIVSTQVGYSMVTLIDPKLGAITPLTLFYMYVAMLVFLQLNGHLLLIKLLIESFESMPLNHYFMPTSLLEDVLKYSQIIFSGAVFLSISIVVTIMITNITIAVMTRFAPQFNIFSIGINISLMIGLISLYVTFNLFVDYSVEYMNDGFNFVKHFLKLK
jgi:flagellar biosynthetic protein FliR